MVWPAIIAGGAAVIGAGASYFGARGTNRANLRRAREQMHFQERMSSTAYQRSMEDMRKAGLNPMLAYKQGGASSPSGAAIPAVNELEPPASSARAVVRAAAEIKEMKARTNAADWAATASASRSSLDTQMMLKAAEEKTTAAALAKTNDLREQMTRNALKNKVGKQAFEKGLMAKWANPMLPIVRSIPGVR
jgi:hypothetical protein